MQCAYHAVAEACYANDFGCSLEQLGLSELITENQRWSAGLFSCVLLVCYWNILATTSKGDVYSHILSSKRLVGR